MSDSRNYVESEFENILSDLKKITLVASPPFKEKKRIEFLHEYVRKIGYFASEIDSEGNLLVMMHGTEGGALVFSAHADTMFPEGTKLEIREEAGKIHCPRICDNSAGIVALLYLLKYIAKRGIKPKSDTIFLFNVGEEEIGNLRGIRHFFDNLKKTPIKAHICVEGHKMGCLTHKFVGSFRARIRVQCKGGHSWRDFGKPNAIVVASSLIYQLSKIKLPKEPKTTFNFGTISGGTSVNSIPSEANFTFEIRSLDKKILAEGKNLALLDAGKFNTPGVLVKAEIIGERPCGETKGTALLSAIREVHKELGIATIDDEGSTDSNYPASLGLPSVTVGIADADGTHSEKEFLVTKPMAKGIEQLLLIFEKLDG